MTKRVDCPVRACQLARFLKRERLPALPCILQASNAFANYPLWPAEVVGLDTRITKHRAKGGLVSKAAFNKKRPEPQKTDEVKNT